MKLLRLKINDPKGFRSLQAGFETYFLHEWDYDHAADFHPYILAGPNGSGKSNVLEVLAAIFYHLECIYLNYLPEDFEFDADANPHGFQPEHAAPDAFELEYFIPVPDASNPRKAPGHAHIIIKKQPGIIPEIRWDNRDLFSDKGDSLLTRLEVPQFLPKYVLGYSSGDNEILSLPFFKMRFIHFDEYRDKLIKLRGYSQTAPEGRLVFLDTQFSQAILLSNFLLQDDDTLAPFRKEVGLENLEEFRLIIGKSHDEIIHDEVFQTFDEEQRKDESNLKKELTSQISTILEKLELCSTAKYTQYQTNADNEAEREYFILDYWVNSATKEAFRFHFNNSPLELFQAFQILLTLNLYHVSKPAKKELYESASLYVNEIVPVSPPDERILRFQDVLFRKQGVKEPIPNKALSDGEHQLLHSLGLCLLFKDEPCLFLLDEPETHFNPDWRAKFISRLRECFAIGKAADTMREMLITTHAPFLISDSQPEYVLLFEKNSNTNQITCSCPDFNTFGASINKITLQAFGKPETIGDYAQQHLTKLEQRFEQGEDGERIIQEASRKLGDSVEKTLFINRILDRLEDK